MFADDIRIYCVYDSHEQPQRHKLLSLSTEKMLECTVKDLGILFDVRLGIDEHIEMVAKKAIRCLFLALRNVQCNDPSLLVRLYNIYIRPNLEYGFIVWSPWMKKTREQVGRSSKNVYKTRVLQALPVYQDRLRALMWNHNPLQEIRANRFNAVFHSFFFRAARWLRMLPRDTLSFSNSKEFKTKSDISRILKVEDVR
ncbi:hypothetical protein COOONC_28013 [Cooperia oncophora]